MNNFKSKKWHTPNLCHDLSKLTFNALLKGNIPAIVHHNFLDNYMVAYHKNKAIEHGFIPYESAEDDIARIGIPLVDYPILKDYLEVSEVMKAKGLYPDVGYKLRLSLMGLLADTTNRKVQVYEKEGKKFWSGVFRSFNSKLGAGIHLDFIANDSPDLSHLPVIAQGSLILHLSTPNSAGGETICYDRFPEKKDKEDKLYKESGWKYSSNIVKKCNQIKVPCEVGSVSLIMTDKYHMVNPAINSEEERRISFSTFFFLLENDETIYFYS